MLMNAFALNYYFFVVCNDSDSDLSEIDPNKFIQQAENTTAYDLNDSDKDS